MVMEVSALKDIIEMRQCSQQCGESKVDIWINAMKGMKTYFESECVKCGHVDKLSSIKSDNFNVAWWTSMLSNGIPETHLNRFLLDMSFSGVSKNGKETGVCFRSKFMTDIRNQARLSIIRVGHADQKKWLQELIDCEDEVVYLSIDGAYPTRGRGSKICFITLMATVNGVKRVISTYIVKKDSSSKKEDENEGTEESEAEGSDIESEDEEEESEEYEEDEEEEKDNEDLDDQTTAKVSSQLLEGIGVDHMLNGPIRQILESGKKIELCCDGDLKIHNKVKDIPNLKLVFDLAHLKVIYRV